MKVDDFSFVRSMDLNYVLRRLHFKIKGTHLIKLLNII